MVRNLLGSLLALVAAVAAAWSPFQLWYGAREGRTYRLSDLFGGLTGVQSALWAGLFVPLCAAAVIALLALLLRSRLLVAFSGLVALGFTLLWLVQQSFESGPLTAAGGGLGAGVGLALGSGVLLLVAAVVLRGRRPRGKRRRGRGRPRAERRREEPLPESRLHEDRTAALNADDDTEFPLPEDELSPLHRSYQADVPRGGRTSYDARHLDGRGGHGNGRGHEYGHDYGHGYAGGGGYGDARGGGHGPGRAAGRAAGHASAYGEGRPPRDDEQDDLDGWDPWTPAHSRPHASARSGTHRIPRRPDDRGPYGR